MYIPKKYNEDDWDQSAFLIKNYPLGTIVTVEGDGIIANHIPFFLKVSDSGKKTLIAHMAKSNHQLPSLKSNKNVLVIFQSVDSYITPSYYPGKQETHKYVPTWDFASVHIHGTSKIVDDFDFVRNQLNLLTDQEEKLQKKGNSVWKVNDAPESYLKILQKAIVGLEIEVESFECKYKFEQGMKKNDIEGVVSGLVVDGKNEISRLTVEANARAQEKEKNKNIK
ncbi:hypothetical protein KGF56_002121 [Candida oxycetoniae]|uniref:Transcriptional regulator n=1 Tax=Candida oxycetoniae TaxID=497107 RepID=A0AAI9WYL4_9ASCO|nr:uncharacterized protein KGF56_002121 [Candida oxycetoniae]KAI3405165.2 hypothetical protein KGF56_002121 [Candida oxycetoniae]